jgi:cobalamin biosynthesis Mg chelatase CobN
MTGAALQALATVGRGGGPAAGRAVKWLRDNQNGDGGFGHPSNAQSTAYAIQGLLAVGADGGTLSRARSYLVGRQRGDGSIAYSSSSNQTPVWVTAQALMALEGQPLPIATAPRRHRQRAAATAKSGDGGGSKAGRGKSKSGGSGKGGGAAAGTGIPADEPGVGAAGGAAATGEPIPESEGTTATALAQKAATQGATKGPAPVPLWAGILAALGLVALLWVLHRFVLPRRADVG